MLNIFQNFEDQEEKVRNKLVIYLAMAKILLVFLIIFIGYNSFSYNKRVYKKNFSYPANEKINFFSTLKTWDGHHYLYLSEKGYQKKQHHNAFYPLYPTMIKVLKNIFLNNTLLTALIISNICFILLTFYFYKLVEFLMDAKTALKAVILLLLFPTSFYLHLVYSEPLFMMLLIVMFYNFFKGRILYSSVFAFLLPLSRPVGILIVLPIAVYILTTHFKTNKIKTFFVKESFIIISILLGFSVYLVFMKLNTGAFLSGFNAQKMFASENSLSKLLNPLKWFYENFVNITFKIHGFVNSLFDRSMFVFYLISLFFIFKKTNKTFFYYSLSMGMIPALTGKFMSYTRILLPIFPLYICYSAIEKKYIYFFLIILFTTMQLILLLLHTLNYWVA